MAWGVSQASQSIPEHPRASQSIPGGKGGGMKQMTGFQKVKWMMKRLNLTMIASSFAYRICMSTRRPASCCCRCAPLGADARLAMAIRGISPTTGNAEVKPLLASPSVFKGFLKDSQRFSDVDGDLIICYYGQHRREASSCQSISF